MIKRCVTFHEMGDEWVRFAQLRRLEGATGTEIVFELSRREIEPHLLRFILGVISSVLFTAIIFLYGIVQIAPSFEEVWLFGFAVSLTGLGMFWSQCLLLHEKAHHTVFKLADWIVPMRLSIILLSFTVAAFPLMIFLPSATSSELINHPAWNTYNRISSFTVILTIPYFSKIFWDYLPLREEIANKVLVVVAIGAAGLFLLHLSINVLLGFYQPPLIEVVKQILFSVLIATGLALGIIRDMSKYRQGHQYTDNSQDQSRIYGVIDRCRQSAKFSITAGFVAGIGLPITAGAERAITTGIDPGSIDLLILVYGYMSIVIIIALWTVYLYLARYILSIAISGAALLISKR